MLMLNQNEKEFIEKLEAAEKYVKGELELDCFNDVWVAMDYREDLEAAFHIDCKSFESNLITVAEAKKLGIDVRKCCDAYNIAYVG